MTQHIRGTCNMSSSKILPTILSKTTSMYNLNRYIKEDRTKHISPKLFYTHDFEENDNIIIQQICSKNNLIDLFTKLLSTIIFEKLVHNIVMLRLSDLK